MRTIKFRAWDGKKIIKDPLVPYDWDLNSSFENPDYQAMMEFTGLVDRNGKEIYESDLVNVNNEKETLMVAWLENRFSFGYKYPTGEFRSSFSFYRNGNGGFIKDVIEVIGNIWENSNLLNPLSKEERNI